MTTFDDGTLRIDFVQREVTIDGQPVHLSPKQYLVLVTLVRRQGQPVSVSELTTRIWGNETHERGERIAVQSYVAILRRELNPGSDALDYPAIDTVPGPGYQYRSRS